MSDGPFQKKVVIWLSAIGGVSLVAFMILMLFGPEVTGVKSAGSDAYSASAVGHKAFADLLERLGVSVRISRFNSAAKARGHAVLIIAEPTGAASDEEAGEKLRKMLELADRTILILPKRSSREDPEKPGWIRGADLVAPSTVSGVMEVAGIKGELVRVKQDELSPVFRGGSIKGEPEIAEVQLIRSTELTPLVTCARGILVGEFTGAGFGRVAESAGEGLGYSRRRLIVISDPDLVSTHGLADGDNAVIAAETVFDLLGEERSVTIDETLHGHELPPTIWGSLLVFPLSLASAQMLLILAILVWTAWGRFGAPLPMQAAVEHGKEVLIGNTADLLVYGGHTSRILDRYFLTTVTDLARVFKAPAGMSRSETLSWLADLGRKRGVRQDLLAIRDGIRAIPPRGKNAEALSAAAMKLHRYKKELLHGS